MKIVHWTLKNGSGLDNIAHDLARIEKELGHDAIVLSSLNPTEWEQGMGADIHVSHSHVPDIVRYQNQHSKVVWIGHGTPEHCFLTSVEEALSGRYGHPDTWMLIQYWLQNADALITFWERHQKIWISLCDKGRKVYYVPLGVNKSFWKPVKSKGKFAGNPSVLFADNHHYIKFPLDLAIIWGWLGIAKPDACLHWIYLPRDQHRVWFPLLNRNGCSYKSYIYGSKFEPEELRNAFVSIDYLIQMVRYGDFNKLTLEAKACGCKVISFANNPYADYWLTEGNQEKMLFELLDIFSGKTEPRETLDVIDIKETATEIIKIYEEIL